MMTDNPSGLIPLEFAVVVERHEVEAKTAGGIILPDETKDREKYATQKATLIAVSPFAFSYVDDEWPPGLKPEVGDKVLVAKYAGSDFKNGDRTFTILNDKDIMAKLDE